MKADELRSRQDLDIANKLMQATEVKRINEMIEKREEKGPMGARRRLLATSVRLNELEAGVQVLMTMMEPSYLEARTDSAEAM